MTTDKRVQRWADAAMFKAEPMTVERPTVNLLWMTPDPLGALAAAAYMYKGRTIRSLAEITDEDRRQFFDDMTKTTLNAAFEVIEFHFVIDGVTRAFTHQLVRQRTAVYFQESMRFATLDDTWDDRVALPPSLEGTTGIQPAGAEDDKREWMRNVWDHAVMEAEQAYKHLVDAGMPAEDARGLVPTNVKTRIHYKTNLRNLVGHAGLRLCTQAQFEWRWVFAQIAQAIRTAKVQIPIQPERAREDGNNPHAIFPVHMADVIADRLFKPICYQTGRCQFRASFDRACKIRDRVEANHAIGRESAKWNRSWSSKDPHSDDIGSGVGINRAGEPSKINAIHPQEWLADHTAARS